MSNKIIPFQFHNHTVRTIDDNGEPLFVASDVANILQYTNVHKAISDHCKGVTKRYILTNGGRQNVNVIPERDVYRLVMNSKMPEAEKFEEWVVGDVLPSIRKTGSYSVDQVKTNQSTPQLPLLEAELLFVGKASEILRCSETSKIRMLRTVAENNGLPTNILPSYTDEKLTRSLTKLLAENDSKLKASTVNVLLEEMGYLEKLSRDGFEVKDGKKTKTNKQFWSITESGEKFGKNETSEYNPRETAPLWFVSKFPDLLNEINQYVASA
jgi:prophage antirepressor-like protein